MLYNIRYWWFFISHGNRWTKYLVHPKIQRPKPCLLFFFFWLLWMAFTCCCPLNWLSIWLQREMVDPCFIHCQNFTLKLLCYVETVANNTLNCRHHVVLEWVWANAAPTLNTSFLLTNVHAKWWIHCFLISSTLLSYAISIYDQPKRVCGVSLVFFRTTAKFGQPWVFSIFCVCMTTFKVSIPPFTV